MAKFPSSFSESSSNEGGIKASSFGQGRLLSQELLARLGILDQVHAANDHRRHGWITVIDPTNQRSLLQACDHCGVVKSENSVVKACSGVAGAELISSAYRQTRIAI